MLPVLDDLTASLIHAFTNRNYTRKRQLKEPLASPLSWKRIFENQQIDHSADSHET